MHERWSRSYVAAGSDHTRHNDSSPVRMNRSEFSPSAPAHRPTIPIHKRQDRVTYCRLVATPIPSHLSRGCRRTRRSMRLGDVMSADDLEAAGLGLERGWVELVEVPVEWIGIGFQLSAGLAASLGALAVRVEHIGSTSVSGLLAKPVLDVAIGTFPDADLAAITERLAQRCWLYRGDAGDQGGHVFVLESRAGFRVAHAHVVEHGATQWCRYLALRDALLVSEEARRRYATEKRRLVAALGRDNTAGGYTNGKSSVIDALLR